MGKKSKAKKTKKTKLAVPGFTPEFADRLSRGLSPEELTDPAVIKQVVGAVRDNPVGTYMFTGASAPSAVPASELPELETTEDEPSHGGTVPLRPTQVLDLHSELYKSLARRDPRWLGYLNAFMQDALSRGVEDEQDVYEKWGVMFQPATTAAEYCGILARQLATARTYQVTSSMVDVVDAVYEKSASQNGTFQPEDVPWPNGFAYLNKPLVLIDRNGRQVKNRAISWNMEASRFVNTKPGVVIPAVRIVCWSWWSDQDDFWTPETGEMMKLTGGLSLAHSVIIPFGHEFRSLHERRVEGFPTPPDDVSQWLHALWLMMESTVPAMHRAADIERHVKHRALRSLNHADVTVVLLRRAVSKGLEEGDPGHRHVDWSCRWPVQGFWRHYHKQDHHAVPDQSRESCVVCDGHVSWVRPHLRGPSDKPLRGRQQLYKLAR